MVFKVQLRVTTLSDADTVRRFWQSIGRKSDSSDLAVELVQGPPGQGQVPAMGHDRLGSYWRSSYGRPINRGANPIP